MKECPVCFSELHESALKCPHCLSFIRPRINEGQFWGTYLIIGGILIGVLGYIWYLVSVEQITIQMMIVGIMLAYLGFIIYGFGTFRSWFYPGSKDKDKDEEIEPGKKRCFFCGKIIDARAIKCNYCLSFLRQEKGKIVATFIVVSGILILTTAYILFLAQNLQSAFYMTVGSSVIFAGILILLLMIIKQRYSISKH